MNLFVEALIYIASFIIATFTVYGIGSFNEDLKGGWNDDFGSH